MALTVGSDPRSKLTRSRPQRLIGVHSEPKSTDRFPPASERSVTHHPRRGYNASICHPHTNLVQYEHSFGGRPLMKAGRSGVRGVGSRREPGPQGAWVREPASGAERINRLKPKASGGPIRGPL